MYIDTLLQTVQYALQYNNDNVYITLRHFSIVKYALDNNVTY